MSSLSRKPHSRRRSSPLTVPLLMPVCFWGLGAPRPQTLPALLVSPLLLGIAALGVLGWRAARAQAPARVLPVTRRFRETFRFTWQIPEEFCASAASAR